MIARVTLEIALRKSSMACDSAGTGVANRDGQPDARVPFGARKVLGVVTALAEESAHAQLRSILEVIGAQTLVTPKILKLARWIGEYYCCPPEIALKSVLPEAVRKEQASGCERLVCLLRCCRSTGEFPKLPKKQREVWNIIEERREMPLQELIELAETTAATVRHLEDKGLLSKDHHGNLGTRSLRSRNNFAHATAVAQSAAGSRAGQDHCGVGWEKPDKSKAQSFPG